MVSDCPLTNESPPHPFGGGGGFLSFSMPSCGVPHLPFFFFLTTFLDPAFFAAAIPALVYGYFFPLTVGISDYLLCRGCFGHRG